MTQTEYELYEQWREDYALMYEPNYDEHLEADCKAAFFAGMKASHSARVSPEFQKAVRLAADALKVLVYKGDYRSRDRRNHKLATIANLRKLLEDYGYVLEEE